MDIENGHEKSCSGLGSVLRTMPGRHNWFKLASAPGSRQAWGNEQGNKYDTNLLSKIGVGSGGHCIIDERVRRFFPDARGRFQFNVSRSGGQQPECANADVQESQAELAMQLLQPFIER
ncbi:hypothetical protein V0R37_06815 [Pollutimonas sp. H1-120]|uniref:hypothetical protein n=1 Tax=Pollutimonas sp. H1-120 TaxID=3148824 RepID=UPI003B5201CE